MRNVVCGRCHAKVPHGAGGCPRCGQPLGPAETHVTVRPIAAQAIQADVQPEYQPTAAPPAPDPPRGRYASWDDFRGNSPVLQRTLLDLATRVLPDMRNTPWARLPVDLPPEADELGVPLAAVLLAQSGTSAAKLVVQRIILLVLFLSAFTLAVLLQRHLLHIIRGGLFVAVTVLFLAVRFGLLRARLLPSVRLWLFEDGILWQDGATVEACRFEDIDEFRAMRDGSQPRFTLVPRRGITLLLTLRSSVAILPLAEYIEIRMASAQLLPKLQRIVAGERVRFGALCARRARHRGTGVRGAVVTGRSRDGRPVAHIRGMPRSASLALGARR